MPNLCYSNSVFENRGHKISRYHKNAAINFALKFSNRSNNIPFNAQLAITYEIKSWDKAALELDGAKKELDKKIPSTLTKITLEHWSSLNRYLTIIANLTLYLNAKDKGKNPHKKSEMRRLFLDKHLAYGIEKFKIFQSQNLFTDIQAPEPLPIDNEPRTELKQNVLEPSAVTPKEFSPKEEPAQTGATDLTTAYEHLKNMLFSHKFLGSNSSGIKLIKELLNNSTNAIATLNQIQSLAQRKINKNMFSYTLSHFTFFGLTNGRHEQIEKLHEMLSQLPVSRDLSPDKVGSRDDLIRKIENMNTYIEQHEFTFNPIGSP